MTEESSIENINKFSDLISIGKKPFINYDELPCDHNELEVEISGALLYTRWRIAELTDDNMKNEFIGKYNWFKHLYFAQSFIFEKAGSDFMNSILELIYKRTIEDLKEEDFLIMGKMMQLFKENLIDYTRRYNLLKEQPKG